MENVTQVQAMRAYVQQTRAVNRDPSRSAEKREHNVEKEGHVIEDRVDFSAVAERIETAIEDLVDETLDNMPPNWDVRVEDEDLEQSFISEQLGRLYV
uniref:Uncharacterized protein n=1 Tax=Magnetococcus massalia (strain MO-1) TaxID=451514 RepID=A0A1S7LN32_MAGMO|nr:conserved protein of unknown function [Candidatus Magnetococcus massalia]